MATANRCFRIAAPRFATHSPAARVRLVLGLIGVPCLALLLGLGCASKDHPKPPETLVADHSRESASDYRAPLWQSTASVEQLQRARQEQAKLFASYRFRPGDRFTVVVPHVEHVPVMPSRDSRRRTEELLRQRQLGNGRAELEPRTEEHKVTEAYQVTVMPDGKIYVPFLDEAVAVEGLDPVEVGRHLAQGEEPLIACINCGYHYSPRRQRCPVCGATPDDRVHAPRLTLSHEARQQIVVAMGGLAAAEAEPLRPTSVEGYWWAICEQGIVGLVERSSERYVFRQAEVAWSHYLGRTHLAGRTLQTPERKREVYLPVQRDWLHLDLITGETSRVSDSPSEDSAQRVPRAPRPGGLAGQVANPTVRVAEIEPEPLNYSVNVTGAVHRPERIPVRRGTRLWDAITAAGGPLIRPRGDGSDASRTRERYMSASVHDEDSTLPAVDWHGAVLMREARYLPEETLPPGAQPHDLIRLNVDFEGLAEGDVRQNVPILPGDLVYIPEFQPQRIRINVAGEVGNPGVYYFNSRPDLMTALLEAGWIDRRRAKSRAIYLVRPNREEGTRDVFRLRSLDVARGHAPNLDLRDGDTLFVDTDALTDVGDALGKLQPLVRFTSEPITQYLRWRTFFDEFSGE